MTAFSAADWSVIQKTSNLAVSKSIAAFYQLNSSSTDQCLKVAVVAQKRRSLRLKISDCGQAQLMCPIGLNTQQITAFLARHTAWLIEQQAMVENRLALSLQQISLHGEYYQIEWQSPSSKKTSTGNQKPKISLDHQRKICWLDIDNKVQLQPHYAAEQQVQYQNQQQYLLDALRAYVTPIFQQCIDRWWPKYQKVSGDFVTQKPRLRVKQMKTRWGSLSQRGNINLNTALIHYPPSALDMVVVHELSHCRYFNHSREFYRLMSAIKPDWKNDEGYLKDPKYRYL